MPRCSQNLSFGWIHTVFPMATVDEPAAGCRHRDHPVQPLCVTDMLIEKVWPEDLAGSVVVERRLPP